MVEPLSTNLSTVSCIILYIFIKLTSRNWFEFVFYRLSLREEEEERRANYERYRTLVENECAGGKEIITLISENMYKQC